MNYLFILFATFLLRKYWFVWRILTLYYNANISPHIINNFSILCFFFFQNWFLKFLHRQIYHSFTLCICVCIILQKALFLISNFPRFQKCSGPLHRWSFVFFFNKFIYLFIYLWLCWVFVSVRGLSLVAASGGYSSSRCAGFSLSWLLLLRSTGSRRAGSVVVLHGLSCSAACGIFPDQGSNPCSLHWQADS